ncbi:MAG: exopolyphosphatase [Desulfobacula sp.]|uniref:exopolyphosphatase n=1 Tax=Desulfobacula sp. TaxID=2593537 RepID=UPI0025C6DAF9|nr:exopolyphosphatase [Desulfobacula sp.]MCD4719387.1 exopolyphosphatase [Desulfobacula sp.]
MRIVTRPDFDGIVCAVLLYQAENINTAIHWVEPNEVQTGKAGILKGDILANLPYSPNCSLWFDHHISNKPGGNFKGAFEIAPSAAGVLYKYYKSQGKLDNHFDELVFHTDIIDAADLNQDQVRYPEKYPYIILSMTIKNDHYKDIPYWNKLVDLLIKTNIAAILEEPEVKARCNRVIEENAAFKKHLLQHTKINQNISITDFRSLDTVPDGNRFLTYSLFPKSMASVKIRFDSPEHKHVLLSIGKNIFNQQCHVNVGNLLAQFGGGGHAGAGGCTLKAQAADKAIEQILEIMFQNKKEL